MKFIIPRQCGKTITFDQIHQYYTRFLSDYAMKLLNLPVISIKYKTAILDKFLSIDNINSLNQLLQ